MAEPVETPRRKLTGAMVPALAAAGLAALGALLIVGRNGDEVAATSAPGACILENADGVGGPIDLLDKNGARVTQADFAGQPALIYFGFTHCPDVCPTSMYAIGETLARDDSYDLQTVLITVDPERDTPQVMGAYAETNGFPPGLVGLTGSPAQIDAAKRAFQVYASRGEEGPPGVYNVDHSSLLYVVDGNWRTVSIIPTMTRNAPGAPMMATPVEQISACITAGLERAS